MRRSACAVAGSLVLTLLLPVPCLEAQEAARPLPYQYVTKFVCGRSEGKIVAPGTYHTAINVHNPGAEPIDVRKRFSVALPSEKAGPVSELFRARLGPSESFEVDCPDILQHLRSREPFVKGFAILESRTELDIVAVYTAAGATRQVETMDVERVPFRRLAAGPPPCPDLVVEAILPPEWDGANRRSIIKAVIKNVGTGAAGPTTARVVDPSTLQSTGAPENAIAPTPALAPGASATVTFHLGYWVYNPDASLEVTADYKSELAECDETNNVKRFEGIG
jgi:hypothetical protein